MVRPIRNGIRVSSERFPSAGLTSIFRDAILFRFGLPRRLSQRQRDDPSRDAFSPRLTQRAVRPKKERTLKKTTDFAAGGGEHAKAVK